MPARADLDLETIIGRIDPSGRLLSDASGRGLSDVGKVEAQEEYAEDYTSDSIIWTPGQQIPSGRAVTDEPERIGTGPVAASTCLDLAVQHWCWDVNGYYASLGVHWKATRGELGRAYLARGGQNSVYLTYVMQQLLNPEKRRAYDRMPLGERFLDDEYVQAQIKAEAAQEASRRTQAGEFTTARQVLEETFRYIPASAEESAGMALGNLAETADEAWEWAYYRWQTVKKITVARLATWQALLIIAFNRAAIPYPVIVGSVGGAPQNYLVGVTDQRWVLYLREEVEPTEDLAAKAVEALLREM